MARKVHRQKPAKETIKVAYFINNFPALSEGFVNNEVIGLRQRGLNIDVYSINRPSAGLLNPELEHLTNDTYYIIPNLTAKKLISAHLFFILRFPRRYLRAGWFAYKHRTRSESLLKTLMWMLFSKKELTKPQRQNSLLHFIIVGMIAKRMLGRHYELLHAHFADSATGLALLTAMLLKKPFSFTAHAYDIFTPQVNFVQKLERAQFIVTCTKYNRDYLLSEYPQLSPEKLLINLHGIHLEQFSRHRRKSAEVPLILSVGRLVPKKGMAILLYACKVLKDKGVSFRCRIVGDGPERPRLEMQIRLNQLLDCVEITGFLPPSEVKALYEEAEVFVLPSIEDEHGDRDGIPNVLAEAMAMEVPVISTQVSGIPELVEDGVSGILMEIGDVMKLPQIITELLRSPARRSQLAKEGRRRVEEIFDAEQTLHQLKKIFVERLHP